MADYHSRLSFVLSLPPEAAKELCDYIEALQDAEADEPVEGVSAGWPDPSEIIKTFDDHVGLDVSIGAQGFTPKEGEVSVWIKDDGGLPNIDLLVFVLERTWQKFRIPDPVGFQWANTCSAPRPDGFGGGFAVIGCDPMGRIFSEVRGTDPLLNDALSRAKAQSQKIDLWVVRATADGEDGLPVIRKADNTWVSVTPETLDLSDAVSAEVAGVISPPKGAFWCRVDGLKDAVVTGLINSDDYVIEQVIDVRPWLIDADPADIGAAAHVDWRCSEEIDQVAYELERMGDPGASRLMNYLGLRPTTANGDSVGFSMSIDAEEAIGWLKLHRPDVRAVLDLEDDAPTL